MAKYIVSEVLKGKVVCAENPAYERKDKGKFIIDECSQQDLQYLYEVVGMKEIELIRDEEPKKKK